MIEYGIGTELTLLAEPIERFRNQHAPLLGLLDVAGQVPAFIGTTQYCSLNRPSSSLLLCVAAGACMQEVAVQAPVFIGTMPSSATWAVVHERAAEHDGGKGRYSERFKAAGAVGERQAGHVEYFFTAG